MKIIFNYADKGQESVSLTEAELHRELLAFLNRFSDAGKKQWMAKLKKQDVNHAPWGEGHYEQFAKRFLEQN